jgi:hypothetical protein
MAKRLILGKARTFHLISPEEVGSVFLEGGNEVSVLDGPVHLERGKWALEMVEGGVRFVPSESAEVRLGALSGRNWKAANNT